MKIQNWELCGDDLLEEDEIEDSFSSLDVGVEDVSEDIREILDDILNTPMDD